MRLNLILIIFFIFITKLSFGQSRYCDFEEVYPNGDIQQGFMLLKDQKLRYEYNNKNLYTIIYSNGNLFVSENIDKNKSQLIDNQNSIIPFLIEIYNDFPNIKNMYFYNNHRLIVEKDNQSFFKRIAINSNNLNVSIFFIDCKLIDIDDNMFKIKPIPAYVHS